MVVIPFLVDPLYQVYSIKDSFTTRYKFSVTSIDGYYNASHELLDTVKVKEPLTPKTIANTQLDSLRHNIGPNPRNASVYVKRPEF